MTHSLYTKNKMSMTGIKRHLIEVLWSVEAFLEGLFGSWYSSTIKINKWTGLTMVVKKPVDLYRIHPCYLSLKVRVKVLGDSCGKELLELF